MRFLKIRHPLHTAAQLFSTESKRVGHSANTRLNQQASGIQEAPSPATGTTACCNIQVHKVTQSCDCRHQLPTTHTETFQIFVTQKSAADLSHAKGP